MIDETRPVAIVTGAARGIGAATVDALVEAGWNVGALDACRDDAGVPYALASPEELDAVAARHEGRVLTVVADVRDQRALDDATDRVVGRFGRLDAAIACAGVLVGGSDAWDADDAGWDVQMDVNLTGVWRLARATIPTILGSDPSRGAPRSFVAVSSAAGTTGLPQLAAYAASKHGVIGLVRSLAAELAPHGVTANVVCPGSTRTPILDASAAVYDLENVDVFAEHHLLHRLIEPTEIAAMIAFVCSDAARAITGAVLPVDAGMTAHGG